ncbi:unnamed protein product [Caenorhabditis sp. 36 PRJEB53466]|nr:unnamed protein product [Caenorhabditis sp. 36 PRJEB53466]
MLCPGHPLLEGIAIDEDVVAVEDKETKEEESEKEEEPEEAEETEEEEEESVTDEEDAAAEGQVMLHRMMKSQTFKITVNFSNLLEVKFYDPTNDELEDIHTVQIDTTSEDKSREQCSKHQRNQLVEFTRVCDHFVDTFRTPITYLSLNLGVYEEGVRILIEWLITQRTAPEYIKVFGYPTSYELLQLIIDNCKPGRLMMYECDSDFNEFNLQLAKNIFFSNPSHWVTMEKVIQMKYAIIALRDSALSSEDLNVFMRQWLAGNNVTLGYLNIKGNEDIVYNIEIILKGLPVTTHNINERRLITGELFDKEIVTNLVIGGYTVRREDGATMIIDFNSTGTGIEFFVLPVTVDHKWCIHSVEILND